MTGRPRRLTAEERWCAERRKEVHDYLARESVRHGRIGTWPAWHVMPYLSLWAIESRARHGWVGWWVICGDVPTDYVSSARIKRPRTAMRAFARRWLAVARCMRRGRAHPTITIGSRDAWRDREPRLRARAKVLARFAKDERAWKA
jgi:hypothetical protein